MQTELEQAHKADACVDEACADGCCADPPGFAKAYWIGIGALFGIILLGSLISTALN